MYGTAACACAGTALATSGQRKAAAAARFAATSAGVRQPRTPLARGAGFGAKLGLALAFRLGLVLLRRSALLRNDRRGLVRRTADLRSYGGRRGGRRSRGVEHAGMHPQGAVAQGGERGVVGREEHRGATGGLRHDGVRDEARGVRVETPRRLIEQQCARRARGLHDDRETAALAGGQVARMRAQPPRERGIGGVEAQQGAEARCRRAGSEPVTSVHAAALGLHAVAREQRVAVVGDECDASGLGAGRERDQQTRLAGAVRPTKGDDPTRVQRQRRPSDHDPIAVAHREVSHGEGGGPGALWRTPSVRAASVPVRPDLGECRTDRRSWRRRRRLDNSAARHRQPPVGHAGELVGAMLGHHDADAGLVGERAEQRDDARPRVIVEVGERLIHEQQDRLLGDRRRDRDEGRLAGRQSPQLAFEQRSDPDAVGDLAHARVDQHPRDAAEFEREADLVRDAAGRERGTRMLQHDAHASREVARGHVAALVSRDAQRPGGPPAVDVRVQSAERAQQGRLPRPRGAGQQGEGPGAEVEVRHRHHRSRGCRPEPHRRLPQGDRMPALAREAPSGIAAQLERRRDRGRPFQGVLEHRCEQPHAAPLTAQPLREPHRTDRVGQGRQRRPRDRDRTREPLHRSPPCAARDEPRHVQQRTERAEREDRQRDRQRADHGVPQSVHRRGSEHHDVRERRRQSPRRQRQHHRPRPVGTVEQHPVQHAHRDEGGREHGGRAQGSGPEPHARNLTPRTSPRRLLRRRVRPARRRG